MSTLEKFGILVILILVVVIGVVAVWGVGGSSESDPFALGTTVATKPNLAPLPPSPWPDSVPPGGPVIGGGPVPPPVVEAPVTPPSVPVAVPAALKTYTVKKGDTLARIAEATLGDANKWKLIADATPGLDPHRLRIGQVLNIPDLSGTGAAVATAEAPASKPPVRGLRPNPDDGPTGSGTEDGKEKPVAKPDGKTDVKTIEYEVKPGDTLTKIAEELLHDGKKYYRIQELNPGLDPRKLRPGQRILVPAAE